MPVELNNDTKDKVKQVKIKSKKITCNVNFSYPKRNITSVSYLCCGTICSVFIEGIYKDRVEIEYLGESFDGTNIINVK